MPSHFDPVQLFARELSAWFGRDSWLIKTLRPFYEALLVVCHGTRGISWTINSVPFRVDPRYRQLMGQEWDPEVAAFLSTRVKSGMLCLDVGANAGVYVLQFCHWTAPVGRVVAFEPNPITRKVLENHVRMNGFEQRVEIAPLAVSDKETRAEFYFSGASGMSRLGQANATLADVAQTTTVTTTTLDAFCAAKNLRPDWLLMDIEGYELHALRGARELFDRCPALQIVVEMHPSLWSSAQVTVDDWKLFLAEAHLRPVSLMGQIDPFQETGSVCFERELR